MSKGEQATTAVVNIFENRLAQLLIEAESAGVILEVVCQPIQPLRMGAYRLVASARSAWRNEDPVKEGGK